jgi:hypothetical protein
VGRELGDHGQFPDAQRLLAGLRLRLLLAVRIALRNLRLEVGRGDQGQGARGNAHLAARRTCHPDHLRWSA